MHGEFPNPKDVYKNDGAPQPGSLFVSIPNSNVRARTVRCSAEYFDEIVLAYQQEIVGRPVLRRGLLESPNRRPAPRVQVSLARKPRSQHRFHE